MSTPVERLDHTAIQAFVKKSNSTHGPAPEASAARLIISLREAYPELAVSSTDNSYLLTLGSLIRYLQSLSTNTPIILTEEEVSDCKISGTIRVIALIRVSDFFSEEDKSKIFTQMASIVSTFPGIAWDKNHECWSTNQIFNPTTRANESVMASPAETLNLVCRAMIDRERYHSSTSGDEADEIFRVESFASSLLRLQHQKDRGQYEICSAGRQHDMLFLLNKSYLDKPRGAEAKPIVLIEDTQTFLLERLTLYIEAQLNRLSESKRSEVVVNWIRWQVGLLAVDTSPLLTYLQEADDDEWVTTCKAYLWKQCEDFGLNPEQCKLDELLGQVAFLPVPDTEGILSHLVFSLLKEQPFPLRMLISGASGMVSVYHLANNALTAMQSAIQSPPFILSESKGVKDFYTIWDVTKTLHHYSQTSLFIGEEEGRFHEVCKQLDKYLWQYYSDFNPGKQVLAPFFSCHAAFMREEPLFNEQFQVNFVENFYSLLDTTDNPLNGFFARVPNPNPRFLHINPLWLRLSVQKTPLMDRHPLFINDTILQRWYAEALSINEHGVATIDISPYQINRILLHAFVVPYSDWTPLYSKVLSTITIWLLTPSTSADSGLLKAFKASYSVFLLSELYWVSLFFSIPSLRDARSSRSLLWTNNIELHLFFIKTLRNLSQTCSVSDIACIYSGIEPYLGQLLRHFNILYGLLLLPTEQLTEIQRTYIVTGITDRLGSLIRDGEDLESLLSLPGRQLAMSHKTHILTVLSNEGSLGRLINNAKQLKKILFLSGLQIIQEHRALIWSAVVSQLGSIIKNSDDLVTLFSLSIKQLTEEQRTQTISVILSQLGSMIQNDYQLGSVLSLSMEQLTGAQRAQIWTAISSPLKVTIEHGFRFRCLLALSMDQFTREQRAQLWMAVLERLPLLFKPSSFRKGQDFTTIMSLSMEELPDAQRAHIWSIVSGQLSVLITDGQELLSAFSLSAEQLTGEQRAQIWMSVLGRLDSLNIEGYQLGRLLALSRAQFTEDQRTQLWTMASVRLGSMIKTVYDLEGLLSLPRDRLTDEERGHIWAAVSEQLPSFIKTGSALERLFSLSIEQLSVMEREGIWRKLFDQLGAMIQSPEDLIQLLSLSCFQLTGEQRAQLFSTIADRLGSFIHDFYRLLNLFSLSTEQLPIEHRDLIMTSALVSLQAMKPNPDVFFQFLSLSIEQLGSRQRNLFWEAIAGQLDEIITDGKHFLRLFSLGMDQLTQDQRVQILRGLDDRLEVWSEQIGIDLRLLSTVSNPAGLSSSKPVDPIKQELISRLKAFCDQAMQRRGAHKGVSSAFFRLDERIPVGRFDEHYVNLFLQHLETCSSIHDAYQLTCEKTLNNLDSLIDNELICIIKESLDRVDEPAAAGFCRK